MISDVNIHLNFICNSRSRLSKYKQFRLRKKNHHLDLLFLVLHQYVAITAARKRKTNKERRMALVVFVKDERLP